MIKDHNLETAQPRAGDRIVGRDPAVHRHEDVGSPVCEEVHSPGPEPVPVSEAVGQEPERVSPEGAQPAHKKGGRGDPVDIVISMNRDPLAGPHSPIHDLHGFRHSVDRERIGEIFEAGVEERAGRLHRRRPPTPQQSGDERGHL
jgi:hypothetical protein